MFFHAGWLGVVLLALALGAPQPVSAQQAQQFDIGARVHIQVKPKASRLHMTHTVEVINQTDQPLSGLDFDIPVSQTNDMRVVYPDGSNIPFEASQQQSSAINRMFQHTRLSLDFPREVTGAGATWKFKISYTTPERIQSPQQSTTIGLPLLDGGVANSWRAVVNAPPSLPEVNYHPPVSQFTQSESGDQLTFTSNKLGRNFLGVSFLNSQTHTLEMTTQLHGSWPLMTTKSVTLPPDLHSQSAFLGSIEPRPHTIGVDRNGNVIAEYRLWPWQQKTVSATATVRSRQLRYDPAGARPVSKTPDRLSGYTSPDAYWPTGGSVGERAQKVVGESDNAWGVGRALHDFMGDEFTVESGFSGRIPADQVLEAGSGNVYHIADTLIALLRSQDVPARLVEGVVYPANSPVTDSQVHAWAEAYIAGVGWVTLDPVWADMFNSFGYNSSDRVAMRIRGGQGSSDGVKPLQRGEYTLQAGGELPERKNPSKQIRVESVRRMVFPGIVHNQRTVYNDGGYVVDDVSVEDAFAGSLAPRARITRETWGLAGFGTFSTEWQVGDQEPRTEDGREVWWPMAIPGVLLLLGGVIQFYRYRLKRYMRKRLGERRMH
jgi:hypothetical protein